jgi:hypothetical protein
MVGEVDGSGGEEAFWGCGECGSVWHAKQDLLQEITAIVRRFPYREHCYENVEGSWEPGKPSKEVADYPERVASEPDGFGPAFVRR